MILRGDHVSKQKLEKLLSFLFVGRWTGPKRRAGPGPWAKGPGHPGPARLPGPVHRGTLYIFIVIRFFFIKKCVKMVDEHGWMLEFRAENDTK